MLSFCFSVLTTPEERISAEAMYLAFRDKLYFLALSLLRNKSDAEDAVQETFVRAFRNMEKLKEPHSPATLVYLIITLKNICFNFFKERKKSPLSLNSLEQWQSPPDLCVFDNYSVIELESALRQLSDEDYEILVLLAINKCTINEISSIFQTSSANIRQRICRARKRLETILKEGDNTDEPKPTSTGAQQHII